jgi:two-component system chemotaxis response regulator CheB
MNGIEFLEKIMKLRPMPVIMVSTLTQRGAEATLAALEIGAFDCIGKPLPGDPAALRGNWRKPSRRRRVRSAILPEPMVGGQPAAAAGLFGAQRLPAGAQDHRHWRLDRRRRSADRGAYQVPGQLPADGDYPAHAGHLHQELCRKARPVVRSPGQGSRGWRPARDRPYLPGARWVTVTWRYPTRQRRAACWSKAHPSTGTVLPSMSCLIPSSRLAGRKAVGMILTGMGRDGAAGLLEMRQAGADHHRSERKDLCGLRHAARRARNRWRRPSSCLSIRLGKKSSSQQLQPLAKIGSRDVHCTENQGSHR